MLLYLDFTIIGITRTVNDAICMYNCTNIEPDFRYSDIFRHTSACLFPSKTARVNTVICYGFSHARDAICSPRSVELLYAWCVIPIC